jgi:hypothetical protein
MEIFFQVSMSIFETIKIVKEKILNIIDASSTKIKADNTNITTDNF